MSLEVRRARRHIQGGWGALRHNYGGTHTQLEAGWNGGGWTLVAAAIKSGAARQLPPSFPHFWLPFPINPHLMQESTLDLGFSLLGRGGGGSGN